MSLQVNSGRLKYKSFSKSTKTETVFTETKMDNEWNVNILKIVPFLSVDLIHWLKQLWIFLYSLVSLFNSISTFKRYLMLKTSLLNSSVAI